MNGLPMPRARGAVRIGASRYRYAPGYSLIELIVSLAVMAILAMLSVQASHVIQRETASSELNDLMASLSYARSTAIKTNQTVTVCKSSDGTHCGRGAAWNDGWITFVDHDRDRILDPEDLLLRLHEGLPRNDRVIDGTGYFYYVMYKPDGSAWPNATFTFCGPAGYRRAIILFRTGRARISSVASNGSRLDCGIS